jgi:TonB family protein
VARKTRAYRSRWLLTPAVGLSVATQVGVFAAYVLTRPTPVPKLTLRLVGDGEGQILVSKVGDPAPLYRCSNIDQSIEELGYVDAKTDPAVVELVDFVVERVRIPAKSKCDIEIPVGTRIQLSAVKGKGATFGGYTQLPMRTPEELVHYLGDPLANCMGRDAEPGGISDVSKCTFTVKANTELAVEFPLRPPEAEVAIFDESKLDDIVKPVVPPAPAVIDAEKLEDKPLEVAIAPPKAIPPPPVLPPPPQQPPPKEEKKKPLQPPPPNMVMVEVKDDKNVKEKAPDDATKLSDKNRDVEEETRAKETNLEKESQGEQVASRESNDTTSPEVGGPDNKIRQNEETKTNDKTDGGKEEPGKVNKGEGGNNGNDGAGQQKAPNILAMRGIEGRGRVTEQGNDARKSGKKGTPGLNTPLSFQDYEKIMGKEKVDDERQVAARKMSSKKGRWERKLDAVKSSLENFVPDVRPGNQTALKTRAHPFALYIARMHRRIHELWGFGFLEDLDDKAADHPLNNQDLWTNLEVSVNPDGSVHKVTIAKTSGKTEFDVAAIDTVLSAAPYETPPEAIRSVNGKVYLRWGFYRNWRQCGTFNVEPYILTDVPDDGGNNLDDGAMVRNTAKLPKKDKVGQKVVTPDDGKSKDRVSPSTSVTDQQALFAANLWVSAFATAQVDKLVKYSTVPFYAGGKVAASNQAELKEMFSGLIVESGPMKDWKLLTSREYGSGGASLPEGSLVLQVRTAKEAFAVVLTRTKSGDYRATQIAR